MIFSDEVSYDDVEGGAPAAQHLIQMDIVALLSWDCIQKQWRRELIWS
jgi:hypothetical protein